ncbi:MAG: hypothetical protein R3D26_20115 [Cyanobacteriota/Melainabacteria group bacterium]
MLRFLISDANLCTCAQQGLSLISVSITSDIFLMIIHAVDWVTPVSCSKQIELIVSPLSMNQIAASQGSAFLILAKKVPAVSQTSLLHR